MMANLVTISHTAPRDEEDPAEEHELYPAPDRIVGGIEPTAVMRRAHAEITYRSGISASSSTISATNSDDADVPACAVFSTGCTPCLRCTTPRRKSCFSLGEPAATGASSCRWAVPSVIAVIA